MPWRNTCPRSARRSTPPSARRRGRSRATPGTGRARASARSTRAWPSAGGCRARSPDSITPAAWGHYVGLAGAVNYGVIVPTTSTRSCLTESAEWKSHDPPADSDAIPTATVPPGRRDRRVGRRPIAPYDIFGRGRLFRRQYLASACAGVPLCEAAMQAGRSCFPATSLRSKASPCRHADQPGAVQRMVRPRTLRMAVS